jgi:hypothetical protein
MVTPATPAAAAAAVVLAVWLLARAALQWHRESAAADVRLQLLVTPRARNCRCPRCQTCTASQQHDTALVERTHHR